MSVTFDDVSQSAYASFEQLRERLNDRIKGQNEFCDRLIVALLADGHLLVEGVPGLAKTQAVKVLSSSIEADFHRIQFTPDLLPSDLIGTEVYQPQQGTFHFVQGPLFYNFVLADEINRAPAKVQSALLEAMAERQITVGQKTYKLPDLFMVMATQNPIEHAGTHNLPEAQLDRFLMHVQISYPDIAVEKDILNFALQEARGEVTQPEQLKAIISQKELIQARKQVLECYISSDLQDYIVELIQATRSPQQYSEELADQINYGASPRATIAIARCASAHAWLNKRDYVSPQDIHAVAHDVLRHRIVLSYQAQVKGITPEHFISALLDLVPVP